MHKQIETWKRCWRVAALVAVLCLGLATLTDAQDKTAQDGTQEKSTAELQAEIDRLQAELQKLQTAKTEATPPPTANAASAGGAKIKLQLPPLPGKYLGMEGDDQIGIVIEEPKDGAYPIAFYEDGLPNAGYDPNDGDKYVGTAIFDRTENNAVLRITLKQKFDGRREEPVELALRELKAALKTQPLDETSTEKNRMTIAITIPRNREWNAVRAERKMEMAVSPAGKTVAATGIKCLPNYQPQVSPAGKTVAATGSVPLPVDVQANVDALAGRYSGHEGDDWMGMVLTPRQDGKGQSFDVVFYEDGLPGAGHDPSDDDRYEGTATPRSTGNILDIRITKKFDEGRERRVERALQNLTATFVVDQEGNMKFAMPRNSEWDAVSLKKSK